MTIKELRHAVGEKHVGVAGTLDCDGHLLPVRYRVDIDADPAVHAERLDQYHQAGLLWAAARDPLRALVGQQLSVGERVIEITDCDLQAWGHSDWRIYVAWKENQRRSSWTWRYTHPSEAMTPEALLLEVARVLGLTTPPTPAPQGHAAAMASLRAASPE